MSLELNKETELMKDLTSCLKEAEDLDLRATTSALKPRVMERVLLMLWTSIVEPIISRLGYMVRMILLRRHVSLKMSTEDTYEW
jgi:hypothetical protein